MTQFLISWLTSYETNKTVASFLHSAVYSLISFPTSISSPTNCPSNNTCIYFSFILIYSYYLLGISS